MSALSKHISDLLYEHDCVIIPGFGGLVGNRKASWFNELNQTFYPSYKELGFNQNLKNNDGLLANQIAQSEGLNYQGALDFIAKEVEQIRAQLDSRHPVSFTEIGSFSRDANFNLRFVQDMNFNYLKASYGLEPVQVVGFKVQSVREKLDVGPGPGMSESLRRSPVRRALLGAYALATLPIAAYMFWVGTSTPLLKKNQDFAVSDLNPFKEKLCATYNYRSTPLTAATWPQDERNILDKLELGSFGTVGISFREEATSSSPDAIYVNLGESSPETRTAVPDKTDVVRPRLKTQSSNLNGHWHIIAGCFSIESNAHGLVAVLNRKGFEARVLDYHKGLWRVTLHSYQSKAQAKMALEHVREDLNPGAWLVRK